MNAASEAYTRAALTRITQAGLPEPELERRFHPRRRWRFDLAWPAQKVAVEIEGGTWVNGRHTRPAGYAGDLEKYNSAALAGWLVLRYTPDQITSGEFTGDVETALKGREG